jgi:hypothetical protein
VAEGEQGGVNPVLQGDPVANQMEPPPRALPLTAMLWCGKPDRRHQVASAELGEHSRIDLVCLAGERGESFDLYRVGDIDAPPSQLQLVVNEAGAIHRLDRRVHGFLMLLESTDEGTQAPTIRRHPPGVDTLARVVHHVDVHSFLAEIQANMQHCSGPPLVSLVLTPRRLPGGGPSSWHSV